MADNWTEKLFNGKEKPAAAPERSEEEPAAKKPAKQAKAKATTGSKRAEGWKPYTLMLKPDTHLQASILVKQLNNGQDLSDVAQQLFEQWIKKRG